MNDQYNQTSFSENRPIYEDEVQLPQPEQPEQPISEKLVWYKDKKKISILGVGIFLLLVILIVIIPKRQYTPPPVQEPPSEQPLQASNSPMLERIKRLEGELEAADPTKPSLIFPPVNMDIRLDE